jgi:6-pyruvoyltetrahydropterin/6-carboxytetrahydropterin synthase
MRKARRTRSPRAATASAPPGAEVTTVHEFSAAHRLHSPELSPAENRALFGACAREHGHTYRLEVTVRGPIDPHTGMVIDLVRLRRLVETRIVAVLDHRHLDRDVPFLAGRISTLENLCQAIWQRLAPHFAAAGGVRLAAVTLAEGSAARVAMMAAAV